MAAAIPLDNNAINAALKSIWGQYRTWAHTSRKYKNDVTRWRNIVLLLSIGGAILGTLSQQVPIWGLTMPWLSKGLGLTSGLALALAAYFTREIFSPDPEGRAVRSRAAAEALKSQSYLMATGAPPFNNVTTNTDLYAKQDRVKKAVENLSSMTLTPEQKAQGLIAAPMAIGDYVTQRVDDQIKYYTDSAIANEKKVAKGKLLSLIFGAAGAILGVIAVSKPSVAAWVAVIGTITAAIAAQQYSGRYQFLILTYQAAMEELGELKSRWEGERNALGVAADQKLVLAAEQVITAENSGWMLEWTKKSDKK